MINTYKNAFTHINDYLKNSPIDSAGKNFIETSQSEINLFNLYKFKDSMSCEPVGIQSGSGYELSTVMGRIPSSVGVNSTRVQQFGMQFTDYDAIQQYRDSVVKAMLIAILDGNSKRTTNIGVGSTASKIEVFYNCLRKENFRDLTKKPWSNWNNSVGICTPVYVSRSNNVAIVTTSPAHGMTTSYDDWGIIMNLNTGIATSFNISTSTYPNGVPITIIDANTFKYENIGVNTITTAVTGIGSIQIGWGGSSTSMHVYLT